MNLKTWPTLRLKLTLSERGGSAETQMWRILQLQFSQLSNLYFLLIAVLQQIPDLSPTGRFGTVATLSVLLFLSLIKETLEDLRRRKADNAVNNRKAVVYEDGGFRDQIYLFKSQPLALLITNKCFGILRSFCYYLWLI